MCWKCFSGYPGACKICRYIKCHEDIMSDGVCSFCYRKLLIKRKCRTCDIMFVSRNELFRHLYFYPEHCKDYDIKNII